MKKTKKIRDASLAIATSQVWQEGLSCVGIVADVEIIPSQRVIEANGGVLIERFIKSEVNEGKPSLRYRVELHRT